MNRYFFVIQLFSSILLILAAQTRAFAQTVFTHRTPEAYASSTASYEASALKLALDKTSEEYGPYELKTAPQINLNRVIQSIKTDAIPNYFASLGYNEDYNSNPDITYIRFPIDLGVLSYRTCFVPTEIADKVAKTNTLDELRTLSIGQGRGWVDVSILKYNGFKVVEAESYPILFKMAAAHRFDLLCRGANEVKEEYDRWGNTEGLGYDRHLLIYYPMPLFFYTNSKNKDSVARVTKGLRKAYADGSLLALWRKHHQASVDFAGLNKRKIFRLENPIVKSIDFDYAKYFYQLDIKKHAH